MTQLDVNIDPLTDRKAANMTLFVKEFQERREVVKAGPVQIDFETTTRCNLKCWTCPKGYDDDRGEHAEREVFERLANATFETARSISLSGFGEPMLSPNFEYFYTRAQDADLDVGFVTNGTILTHKWVERLAGSRNHIFVSIDAVSDELMNFLRPGLKFDKLKRMLNLWRKLREENPENKSHVFFNFVPTQRNIHELPGVIDLAAEAGAETVEVMVYHTYDIGQEAVDAHLKNAPELARKWLDISRNRAASHDIKLIIPPGYEGEATLTDYDQLAEECDAPLEVNPVGSKYPLACSAPWFRIYVRLKGDVYPCCSYPGSLGNISSQSWDEIWNGAKFRELRRKTNSRFPTLGCKNCRLVWGITGGEAEEIFNREKGLDRLHTQAQKFVRKCKKNLRRMVGRH